MIMPPADEFSPQDDFDAALGGFLDGESPTDFFDAYAEQTLGATPAFRNKLEDRLGVQLRQMALAAEIERKRDKMQGNGHFHIATLPVNPTRDLRSPARIPLTLVAALLMMIIGGVWLVAGNRQTEPDGAPQTGNNQALTAAAVAPSQSPEADNSTAGALLATAQAAQTEALAGITPPQETADLPRLLPPNQGIRATLEAEMTRVFVEFPSSSEDPFNFDLPFDEFPLEWQVWNLSPVVIALQPIHQDEQFTREMLGVVYFPAEILPPDAYGTIEEVVGQNAPVDIPRWTPIQRLYTLQIPVLIEQRFSLPDGEYDQTLPFTLLHPALPLYERDVPDGIRLDLSIPDAPVFRFDAPVTTIEAAEGSSAVIMTIMVPPSMADFITLLMEQGAQIAPQFDAPQ